MGGIFLRGSCSRVNVPVGRNVLDSKKQQKNNNNNTHITTTTNKTPGPKHLKSRTLIMLVSWCFSYFTGKA